MRLLGGLLICCLVIPTHQFIGAIIGLVTGGLGLASSIIDSNSMGRFAELARSINANLAELQEMAESQLQIAMKTDHRLQEMDRKLELSFAQTFAKIDENARLIAGYSQALSGKMDNVYTSLSSEVATHSRISLELYSDFRNQAIGMLDYLAQMQKLSHEETMAAHADLNKLLHSAFNAISDQLYHHYLEHSKQIKRLEDNMLYNLSTISDQQDEVKRRLKIGFEETRTLFAKNEQFLKGMRQVFVEKFHETLQEIRNNAETLEKVREDIRVVHRSMIGEFRDLEQTIREEIRDLWAFLNNNDVKKNLIIPINDTLQKMNHYIEDQDAGSQRRFVDSYKAGKIGSMATYILHSFKPWMEAHFKTASVGSNYNYKTFEAFRDLLIQHYNLTNILHVFYEAQSSQDQVEYKKMLRQANRVYEAGLEQLMREETHLRKEVALHEFRVIAHRSLRLHVDPIDDDWDDEEIRAHLTKVRQLFDARKWSNSSEPINDYILFTTHKCEVIVDDLESVTEHFLEHTNPSGFRFYLYRYRRDVDEERIYQGDYKMRNPLAERTLRNVIHDRISRETLNDEENNRVAGALKAFRESTHKAVAEICENNCKIVLTTGDCLIMASGLRKFGAMISPFNQVQMFVGF